MHADQPPPIPAELRQLRAEVEKLRSDCERLQLVQRQIMELIGAKSPEKIIHDLRNVLNERELYRALADMGDTK